jgi:bla regulator protein blaR1
MQQKTISLVLLGFLVIVIPLLCQTPAEKRPSFEVATIKPSDPGQRGSQIGNQPGGRLVIRGVPVSGMMTFAYNVRNFQITGGPGWMSTDRWDIEARAEEGSVPPPVFPPDPNKPNPMALRLQSLLEDRFQLKLHRETKELPIYELTVAKGGPRIKLNDDQTPLQMPERGTPPPPLQAGTMPRFSMRVGRGSMEAVAMDIRDVAQMFSNLLGRTVVDKTGLKGLYDVKMTWTPDQALQGPPGADAPPVDPSGPSIFTAVQEQLGLKLDSAKGPVEVIVVDGVQKPSEN